MKKFTLIVLVVILISLFMVIPAFAGEGPDHPGKACEHLTGSGIFWGWGQGIRMGNKQGHSYGPVVADFVICH